MPFNLELADDYTLIGIHSTEEDYKLAYLINLNLETRYTRSKLELDFEKKKDKYSVFEFIDKKNQLSNYLISNKYNGNTEALKTDLFSDEITFSSTSYLIQEKKEIDFFLKIEGDISTTKVEELINQLNSIKQIITSYNINPETLKSKDYLIF